MRMMIDDDDDDDDRDRQMEWTVADVDRLLTNTKLSPIGVYVQNVKLLISKTKTDVLKSNF